MRVSYDSPMTFVKCLTTVVRPSCECLATVLRMSLSFIFSHKSPNGLIYVPIYSHLYFIFVALCGSRKLNCNVSAMGSRRFRDGFALHSMTWQLFCEDFCCKKSITCLKLSRTVRDQFATHARTLRSYQANVSRQFRNYEYFAY